MSTLSLALSGSYKILELILLPYQVLSPIIGQIKGPAFGGSLQNLRSF
jgi:hypothetical protein